MTNSGAMEIADRLRQYLRAQKLDSGSRLPSHGELSRELGIGINRLREGLAILEQEGLIVTNRKAGTRVKDPSVEALREPIGWHLDGMGYTVEDLIRARAAMESGVAAEAALARTTRDQLEILEVIEQFESLPEKTSQYMAVDQAFHFAILKATHNPVMRIFGELIEGQFHRKAKKELHPSRAEVERIMREHRAIFEAIESKDTLAARERMYQHIIRQLS
jgi:GntR family transcriptional regulator, transcriptional repressor for pyruvate dehydrogenase complex